MPRRLGSNDEEEHNRPDTQLDDPESLFFRRSQMRELAKKHIVEADSQARLKRVMMRQKPTSSPSVQAGDVIDFVRATTKLCNNPKSQQRKPDLVLVVQEGVGRRRNGSTEMHLFSF